MNPSDIEAMLDSMKISVIEDDGKSDEFCGMAAPPSWDANGSCYFALIKKFDSTDSAVEWMEKVSEIDGKA